MPDLILSPIVGPSLVFLFIVITGPYTETTITGPTKIKGNEVVIAGGFQE